ncbi:MAG: hypothetical protein WB608_07255 [Terracidiphilus sp.]
MNQELNDKTVAGECSVVKRYRSDLVLLVDEFRMALNHGSSDFLCALFRRADQLLEVTHRTTVPRRPSCL